MKKLLALLLALAMTLALAACGAPAEDAGADTGDASTTEDAGADTGDASASEDTGDGAGEETPDAAEEPAGEAEEPENGDAAAEEVTVRVGSLKGPTSIGLAKLRSDSEAGQSDGSYAFTLETDASALLTAMVNEELDIALIPANAASIWYNRLEGGVTCLDVNTLGVLYVIAADGSIASIEDLAGRTIYLPGQGTSPDYVLQYLLSQHGMSLEDVTVEYQSEATEVIAALTADPEGIGLLPQPSVTAALGQLEGFAIALDLTEEWGKVCDTGLLTGVTVVRTAFLNEHPEAVGAFLAAHEASAAYVSEDVAAVAQLVEEYGIMASAAVAEKAIPSCNVTFIAGEEMRDMVSGYLQVLYDLDPSSVGGALPDEAFYYLG